MIAFTIILPLLLLLPDLTAASPHLPSHLDRSCIRTTHRRHHARRAQIPCNDNVAPEGFPVMAGQPKAAVLGNSFMAVGINLTSAGAGAPGVPSKGTSTVLPGVAVLVAGPADDGTSEAAVKPAPPKASSLVTGDLKASNESKVPALTTPSNGIYSIDTIANKITTSQSVTSFSGDSVPQADPVAARNSTSPSVNSLNANTYNAAPVVATVCNHGDWHCEGMALKRCNWNEWVLIAQCSGDNIICSDQGSTVGCVWTWSVPQQVAPVVPSPSTPAAGKVQTIASPSTPVVGPTENVGGTTASLPPATQIGGNLIAQSSSSSVSQRASGTITPLIPSFASTSTSTTPTATSTNAEGEVQEEWDEEVWEEDDEDSSSSVASASMTSAISGSQMASASTSTISSTSTATTTPSASASASAGSGEEDDCEEWEDENGASTSASDPISHIGNHLIASPCASSSSVLNSASSSAAAPSSTAKSASSTSSTAKSTPSTSSIAKSASSTSSTCKTASSASSQRSSATTSSPTTSASIAAIPVAIPATVSASNAVLSNLTNPSKTLSIIDVPALSISTVSLTSTAAQGVITGDPTDVAGYSAPHYVIYSDLWLFAMPDVSTLKSINRFVLAFWMSDQGPVDNAQMWTWMSQADRQRVLDSYHKAGIALMVSAFGSTDQPTTWGKDPIAVAQSLAKFVIAYQFDGVDIDYEDMGAMNSDKAETWLIPFQKELRRLLPQPYLISHAPVAPWFTSSNAYRSGAYVAVHQSVGDGIDFYNMQFYNQGDGVYTDCTTLVTQSGGYWPGTSVMEMNSYAKVPLDKIVIGKPLDAAKANNGYMSPEDLNKCVQLARSKGWNGGVMFWEWTTDAPRIMATSRA